VELTAAAYSVALRHGAGGEWLDLELELWETLGETVRKWGQGLPRGGGQPDTAHGDVCGGSGTEVMMVRPLRNRIAGTFLIGRTR